MAFKRKTWKDRDTTDPAKFIVVNTNDEMDFERVAITRQNAEGTVQQAGDAFSAANMNDLEGRIAQTFATYATKMTDLLNKIYPVGSVLLTTSFSDESQLRNKFGSSTRWQKLGTSGYLSPTYGSEAPTVKNNSGWSVSKALSGQFYTSGSKLAAAYADLPTHSHYYNDAIPSGSTWIDPPNSGPERGSYFVQKKPIVGVTQTTSRTLGVDDNSYNTHSHGFHEMSGVINGSAVNINISQPYRQIYAWRRTQ